MDFLSLVLLAVAGMGAGLIAGLVGVGGGIIFAPVLFFYFSYIGVSPAVVAQLTIGSSLFCTLIAASTSAFTHHYNRCVDVRMALTVGAFSTLALTLMTTFVTTRPWYDGTVFQVVFSLVLLAVVARMLVARGGDETAALVTVHGWPALFLTGSAAGAIAAGAGVGGGAVLVPSYHHLLGLPMRRAVGTSSATIILTSLVGVISFAVLGWGAEVPAGAVGYVHVGHSLALALGSIAGAQIGAYAAHRVPARVLRFSFAAVALVVAARLLYGAAGDLF